LLNFPALKLRTFKNEPEAIASAFEHAKNNI